MNEQEIDLKKLELEQAEIELKLKELRGRLESGPDDKLTQYERELEESLQRKQVKAQYQRKEKYVKLMNERQSNQELKDIFRKWEEDILRGRRPEDLSATAMHSRMSPCLRKSCALSSVLSRSRTTVSRPAAANRSCPRAAESSVRRRPSSYRPSPVRCTSPWVSRAAARRCAVARGSSVITTSSLRFCGPSSRASRS